MKLATNLNFAGLVHCGPIIRSISEHYVHEIDIPDMATEFKLPMGLMVKFAESGAKLHLDLQEGPIPILHDDVALGKTVDVKCTIIKTSIFEMSVSGTISLTA
jgi:hypothetical protein